MRLGLFEDVADRLRAGRQHRRRHQPQGQGEAGRHRLGRRRLHQREPALTGFLELGHNNVLGNGQTLSLHLERGGKRSDYSLSFTEPWFRDTPTLLGFSVFNTHRERDLYTEKRVGGSVRIGRPLPWPDYSRGSLAYRLENVHDRLARRLADAAGRMLRSGHPARRAAAAPAASRSTSRATAPNNPFYPTSGTRLTLNERVRGRPVRRHVNFHKHRSRAALYLPSVDAA